MMSNESFNRNGTTLKELILKRAIVAAIAAIVVIASISILVPSTVTPQIIIEKENNPSGHEGFNLTSSLSNHTSSQTMLNDTPFLSDEFWTINAYSLSSDWSTYQITQLGDHAVIAIENGECEFTREFSVNVAVQNTINLTLKGKVISGQVEIFVRFYVWSWYTPNYYTGNYQYITKIDAGERIDFSFFRDISNLKTLLSPRWIASISTQIEIVAEESCVAQIDSAIIETTSEEPLATLTVDMQNTGMESIYDISGVSNTYNIPGINITDLATSEWSVITPMTKDLKVYLPSGNFSCTAGLFNYSTEDTHFEFLLSLDSRLDYRLVIRVEMIRIDFSMTPDLPQIGVSIRWSEEVLYCWDGEITPPYSIKIFIPAKAGELIVSIVYLSRIDGRLSLVGTRVSLNGTLNLKVSVKAPFFSFLGGAATAGDIVLIAVGIALLIMTLSSLNEITRPYGWEVVIKDPKFIPILILGASALFPWLVESHTGSNLGSPPHVLVSYYYVPFCVKLIKTQNSLLFPLMYQYLIIDLIFKIMVFWIPLLYGYSRIGFSMKSIWNDYLYAIAIPFILVILTLFDNHGGQIGPGLVLAAIAPAVYVVQRKLYRKLRR